jgi:Flp pilus assembly protein TadG
MAPDLARAPARVVRRFLRSTAGTTALEFALVGPVLLVLVLAIIENGLMLFAQALLDNATVAAARQVQIGAITNGTNFGNAVCGGLSTFFDCSKMQYYVASSTKGFPSAIIPSSTGTFSSPGFTAGSGGYYVIAEVAYDRTYVSPWLVSLSGSGWVLLSVQAFQNEPFS